MNPSTKISIIIPSFNQGRFLADTLRSIIDQNYENVEIIVMDGGSTDNSVDVIKSFEPYITYWQSEKDGGQSAAINNGIKRATGEFVTWLNSDDVLLPGALNAVNKAILRNPNCDFFLGNTIWIDKSGLIISIKKVEPIRSFFANRHFFSNGGPSAFMRKSTLEKVGLLREDFHYMMDTELWHRFIANKILPKRITSFIWGLRFHEDAKTSGCYFENSKYANKDHPSWVQKKIEFRYISDTFKINNSAIKVLIWRVLKPFRLSFYSRYIYIGFKGKHYSTLSI